MAIFYNKLGFTIHLKFEDEYLIRTIWLKLKLKMGKTFQSPITAYSIILSIDYIELQPAVYFNSKFVFY